MEHFVEFEDVCKYYQTGSVKIAAADHLNFYVDKGEFCIIVGPSGAGKTTLLNILGGMDNCDEGNVWLDGRNVSRFSARELTTYRRYDVGFVFQFYNLVPDLTIKENIEVTAHLSKNPLNVDDLLRSLGLYEHRNKFPRQVSGGQQQRCAIGRALVKNPGLLLCDEPTGALDYKTSKEILQLMEDVNRTYGCTIIIVTHNAAIARMANRVLRLRDGRIVEDELNESPVAAAELDW